MVEDDYVLFETETEAIHYEADVSNELGLPSSAGERWDIPMQRENSDGVMMWSVIYYHKG